MIRCKLLCLILASQIYYAVTQEGDPSKKGEPPDKLALTSPGGHPRSDQESWMSKIFSWVLPFGSSPERRGDFNGGYQYLPSQSHIEKDCNPCNQEPWIPMTSVGHKTVKINYVPPVQNFQQHFSDFSVLETLHPPPAPYKTHSGQFGPTPQFTLKDTRNNIGLVQQFPSQNYGPPPGRSDIILVDYMVPPPVNYKVPSLIYGPPKVNPASLYKPPPYRELKPIYNHVPFVNNHQQHIQQPPNSFPQAGNVYLPPSQQDYIPPVSSSDVSYLNHQLNTFDEGGPFETSNVPSDSYGVPVTGDSLSYFSPPEQLSLGNEKKEFVARPVPLPNLSSYPILPFRNHGDFNKKSIESSQVGGTQVNIQESVRVADWLASIEHPISVVQSPLIELSIKGDSIEENENSNTLYSGVENNNEINTPVHEFATTQVSTERNVNTRVDKAHKYDNINEQLQNDDKKITVTMLSENPIVVDDAHAAASNNNDTFLDSNERKFKRGKDDELEIPNTFKNEENVEFYNQLSLTGSNIIKEMLLNQKTSAVTNSTTSISYDAVNNNFTMPPLDYGKWSPTFGVTMSTLKVSPDSTAPFTYSTAAKKTKPLQIIVPYISNKSGSLAKDWANKKHNFHQPSKYNGAYTTLLPVFVPPDTTHESVWPKYNSLKIKPSASVATPKATTAVYNIKELYNLKTERPYDIVSLQKHINDWTQQAYSHHVQREPEQISLPKEIPREYFTTQAPITYIEAATIDIDHLQYNLNDSKSNDVEEVEDNNIDSNLIVPTETTTEKRTTIKVPATEEPRVTWDDSKVTISSQTKEKVYIVTPQTYSFYTSTPATAWSSAPKVENGKVNNDSTSDSHRFSIKVVPENTASKEAKEPDGKGAVKIVFSEWPHLINNLETTTKKPSSRHPLFGLMDIVSYTPPPNSTVETILGHSRVATAVTSPSISEKETKRSKSDSEKFS